MSRTGPIAALLAALSSTASVPPPEAVAAPAWNAALTVRAARRGVPGYASSSQLEVEFIPAAAQVDHYLVAARDASGGPTITARAAPGATRMTLTGLQSDTNYAVDLTACHDAACSKHTAAGEGRVFARTAEEVWQVQASGASIAEATRIVADGNVKIHAILLGPGAPAAVAGRVQLYYGPLPQQYKGLAVAVSDSLATNDASSVSRFTSLAGSAGLLTPAQPAALVREINTGQAVPLASGAVRLLFEAQGADGRTRILSLDSQDGYLGRDFNAGPATVCSTGADYASGGPCAPAVAVGIASDASGNTGFTDARQFKVGYPALDDWRWQGTPGTFMVLTVSGVSACSSASRTSAYALWDGSRWEVQYRSGGCPKLFENIQAPMPVHVGGGRYKMYFGNPTETTGALPGSRLPFLGPKRVAYADAAATGDPARVEFEDWEPLAEAREVRFVWPSGRELSDAEEGYLDDFVMLMPTGDPGFQVMYTGMTDGNVAPFATMAVLLNP